MLDDQVLGEIKEVHRKVDKLKDDIVETIHDNQLNIEKRFHKMELKHKEEISSLKNKINLKIAGIVGACTALISEIADFLKGIQ